MSKYKKYINKYWKAFTLALFFLAIEAVCDLLQPTIMSKIIDNGVAAGRMDYVFEKGGVMLLITAMGALGAVTRNIISSKVSQSFASDLRLDLFKKVQGLSFQSIDKLQTASLITRLTNDITQVQGFVHGMMRIFVKAPIVCAGSLIMAVILNPGMAIILAVVVPLVAITIYFSMKTGYPHFIKVQKALDKVNMVMREYLSGVRVVKAFNRFKYETERFETNNDALADENIKAMRVMAKFNPVITFVVNVGIVAVLWFGGFRVNNSQVEVGQIIAFTNYMTQILFSLMMISHVFMMFIRARASAERIIEVFEEENSLKVSQINTASLSSRGRVDFENVSFSYSSIIKNAVIKNVSLSIMPGETIGIIGSTGSGKSSLVSLIPRFYDCTTGVVKIDGIDVKNLDIKNLRNKIALVPQKTVLFTGTILENIKWGNEKASINEVIEASKIAQAHNFVDTLPEGYSTFLGQGGVNLSGGQKQRISIARALIKKPEILILDDSTSAVDVSTESKIREALKEYSKELTVIIIAQRIISVMGADKIIVLDNGEIVGIGTHESLIDSCQVYMDIFRSQIGKELMNDGK